MSPHLCSRCRQLTYPERWCECDPRQQISDFLAEDIVYLMDPDDDADDGLPLVAGILLR